MYLFDLYFNTNKTSVKKVIFFILKKSSYNLLKQHHDTLIFALNVGFHDFWFKLVTCNIVEMDGKCWKFRMFVICFVGPMIGFLLVIIMSLNYYILLCLTFWLNVIMPNYKSFSVPTSMASDVLIRVKTRVVKCIVFAGYSTNPTWKWKLCYTNESKYQTTIRVFTGWYECDVCNLKNNLLLNICMK